MFNGMNPVDDFTGRTVLTTDEFKAGGLTALGAYASVKAPQVGGIYSQVGIAVANLIMGPNLNQEQYGKYEWAVKSIPLVNRFVGLTAAGDSEIHQAQREVKAREDARVRVTYPESAKLMSSVYNGLHNREHTLSEREKGQYDIAREWKKYTASHTFDRYRKAIKEGDATKAAELRPVIDAKARSMLKRLTALQFEG
jgi:hypothetical protein